MDRDNVIKGLDCRYSKYGCAGCPYYNVVLCESETVEKALAMLKEQKQAK